MASPTTQEKEKTATSSTNDLSPSPTPAARVAVGYTPELIEPGITIPGGAFSVAFAGNDFRRLELQPGLNFDVDPDLWAKAQPLPAVQELLAVKALEEISLQGDGGATGAVLKRESETMANFLVLKCRDLQQLEMWLQVEERPAVQASLRRRIKQLKEGVG